MLLKKNKNQNARVSRGVGAALKSMIRLLIMSTTKVYMDFAFLGTVAL